MSNQDEVGTGRAPYIPSARRSIHNHDYCIFSKCADMGRYGVKTNPRRELRPAESSPQREQGIDQVDNVMSKFTRQTSPVPLRQLKCQRIERRNSLNTSDSQLSEDDEMESDLLAKSLPANLPSYYCSSNNFAHESEETDLHKTPNNVSFSEITAKTQANKSNEHLSTSASFEEYVGRTQVPQETKKSCHQIMLPILGVFSLLVALYYNGLFNLVQGTNNNYDKLKFKKDMNSLGEKYNINDNSILEVQSGISTILERNDTGSFIFIYNGQSVNFNYLEFSNFMHDIASTAARYLRNESVYNQPIVIHSSELDMQSHSELMKKYRYEVAKTGVMLVKDLDRIPSSLAMAFHYFCDEYNPLVAKSAIFFTLNLANCSNYPELRSTHSDVEKCLANVWNKVPKNNIKPLLARVVNVVIDVTNI